MNIRLWLLGQFKKKPRIYIMPTAMGGYLNGLIFLMFFLAVGYNNNLLLIFTLFLFGLNLIWVIQTHFHLHALKLQSVTIKDGHVGENIGAQVYWKSVPEGPYCWELSLEKEDGQSLDLKSLSYASKSLEGQVIFNQRGIWSIGHLKIKSQMPFGLYRAWIYLKIDMTAYVYPEKIKNVPPLENVQTFYEGENSTPKKGPFDVFNLGPYQLDESRRISWKHYARTGELLIKEGEELTQSLVHFRVTEDAFNKELVLSKITTQMLLCLQNEMAFTLETPHKKMGPGLTSKHLCDCLRELCRC